jgi:YHS domain-containing protein
MYLSIKYSGISKTLLLLVFFLLMSFQACAKPPISSSKDGVAIDGYDAVAYFTLGKPVQGSEKITHSWQGATWRFVNEEHRDKFAAEPEKYAPQYGGYCAYAMSDAGFAAGDGERWAIVEDRLYLNNNWLAQKLWEREIPEDIRDADGHWVKIKPIQEVIQSAGEASKP